jgi:hypothetical protein
LQALAEGDNPCDRHPEILVVAHSMGQPLNFPVRLQHSDRFRSIDNTVTLRPRIFIASDFGNPYHAICDPTTMLNNDEFNRLIDPDELVATFSHVSRMHFSR